MKHDTHAASGRFAPSPERRDRTAYRHAYYMAHREQEHARTNAWRDAHKAETNRRKQQAEATKRRAKQIEVRRLRPRCMICNAPIRHGATGVRYDTVTCGRKVCQMKRYRWFVRPSAAA